MKLKKVECHVKDLKNLFKLYEKTLSLMLSGLCVCLHTNEKPEIYFKELQELSIKLQLNHLSMGMSHDYLTALDFGSSFLRLGTCIFGEK